MEEYYTLVGRQRVLTQSVNTVRGAHANLAFTAFVARLEHAGMPLIIVRVRLAEPALARFAENRGGRVARFVQAGNTLT